jgi:hypothetical protein
LIKIDAGSGKAEGAAAKVGASSSHPVLPDVMPRKGL